MLSNGTLGVLAQGSAGVPGSGYSTPTQGTGFYGSQGNYPDARDVPSAFDAPHNEDLPGIVRGD